MKMIMGAYIPTKRINRKVHEKMLQNSALWCATVLLCRFAHHPVPQALL